MGLGCRRVSVRHLTGKQGLCNDSAVSLSLYTLVLIEDRDSSAHDRCLGQQLVGVLYKRLEALLVRMCEPWSACAGCFAGVHGFFSFHFGRGSVTILVPSCSVTTT